MDIKLVTRDALYCKTEKGVVQLAIGPPHHVGSYLDFSGPILEVQS
jgi:hypothetical protein